MPGLSEDEGNPSPQKKTGSARTSKKSKKRNVFRYLDWSEEREYFKSSSTRTQEQAQDVEYGNEASPESAGEATIPAALDNSPQVLTFLEYRTSDTSLNKCATAAESTSPPDAQCKDAPPLGSPTFLDLQIRDSSLDSCVTAAGSTPSSDVQGNDVPPPDSRLSTTSEPTGEHYGLQQDQEEQKADSWTLENMRPNTQNLRYGGYPAQPAPQHRNTPLGSGRLQNTSKLGAFELLISRVVQRKAEAVEPLR